MRVKKAIIPATGLGNSIPSCHKSNAKRNVADR